MKIGEKLPILRKRCGLSQEDLANELDVSRQSVYKWETNESQPDIAKIQKMAKILGVSFDYLLDENIDVTKVDDVPKDIISTDTKYRAVFNSGKELSFSKADEDHGIFEKDEYEEVEQNGIFAKSPTKITVLDLDKETINAVFETNQKKMAEYLDSKGYEWLMPHPFACVAFFIDDKNKTFGFWYDGAEQFVCPIENLIDIKISNDMEIQNSSKPKLGLLLGGIFGVGVENEDTVSIKKPTCFDVDITYITEEEKTNEFNITFNTYDSFWIVGGEMKSISDHQETCALVGEGLVKQFDRIDAKLKALKLSIDKIKTGKLSVANPEVQVLAENAKQAEIQYNNDVKKIKAQFVADKKAKKKKKLIRNLIIAAGVILFFGICLLCA